MATRLPLQPTADGFALTATVVINQTPRRLIVDTSSSVGISLACSAGATDATACFADNVDACTRDNTFDILWGTPMCKRDTPVPMNIGLGALSLTDVPVTILTYNATAVLRGTDGILGLAVTHRGVRTTRALEFTDTIQTYALEITDTAKTLVLNGGVSAGYTTLHQLKSTMNETAVGIRGFRAAVDPAFVKQRNTRPSNFIRTTVDGWLDAAWPSIIFPIKEFNSFYASYLKTCVPHKGTAAYPFPHYYYCGKETPLPRLAFTTTNGTFFLDRDDYVQADPNDSTRTIVLVQNYSNTKFLNAEWGLGLPFVRKFPSYYDGTGKDYQVTLSCHAAVTCDPAKWAFNGTLDDFYDDEDTSDPVSGSDSKHAESSSSHKHSRLYWYIAIPILVILILVTCVRRFKQLRIDHERRRRLREAAANEHAPTAPAPKPSDQPNDAESLSAAASYRLLGGPATLKVTGHTPPENSTSSVPPAPFTGNAH